MVIFSRERRSTAIDPRAATKEGVVSRWPSAAAGKEEANDQGKALLTCHRHIWKKNKKQKTRYTKWWELSKNPQFSWTSYRYQTHSIIYIWFLWKNQSPPPPPPPPPTKICFYNIFLNSLAQSRKRLWSTNGRANHGQKTWQLEPSLTYSLITHHNWLNQ